MRRQVSELKKTIEETKNMTVQKLIYLGKILDEDKTLAAGSSACKTTKKPININRITHEEI